MTHPSTPPTPYDLFVSYRRKDAKAVHAAVAAFPLVPTRRVGTQPRRAAPSNRQG